MNTELITLLINLQDAIQEHKQSMQSMLVLVPGCIEPQEERLWYIDGDQLQDNITRMIDTYEKL